MSNGSIEGNGTTAEPTEGSASEAPPKKKRTPRKRTKRTTKSTASAEAASDTDSAPSSKAQADSSDSNESSESSDGAPRKTKRRSRRKSRRKPAGEQRADDGEAEERPNPVASQDDEDHTDDGRTDSDRSNDHDGEAEGDEDRPKRRRRGTRGGRRRKKRAPKDGEAAEADAAKDDDGEASDEAPAPQRDRPAAREDKPRGKRSLKRAKPKKRRERDNRPVDVEVIPGEDDDLPELVDLPDEAELVSDKDGRRGRRRRGRKSRDEDEDFDDLDEADEELPRDETILVNAVDKLESRVAVVRDERIGELFLEVNRVQSYVHNIYRGKVVNIESAIGAAFVDFGQGKNGFLHVSDVLPEYGDPKWNLNKLLEAREGDHDDLDLSGVDSDDDSDGDDDKKGGKKNAKPRGRKREGARPSIGDLLKVGDKVVVQITKDAIGDKGPALTTYISIPGRFIVLMPSLEMVGVSRKIEDEKERKRLRKIMQSFEVPSAMGLIVRTAGVGKTKADLKRDMDYLLALWESFSKRLLTGKTPCALYQENDLAIRTMRDMFTRRTEKVVVDDEAAYNSMVEFAEKLMPEHVGRVERHTGDRPLFHQYGVEQDYERIFNRRVDLPSGGSIVIDQTEALVAIDVNSGRTRGEGAVFEDIALKTNLEAVSEIALQIKLRDLGGILVLDFIDMMRKSSRLAVERALRDAMASYRARHKVGRISQFGLLELTRQRLGPGLSKLLYTTCLTCRGTGRQRTPEARAQGILRRLGSALTQKGFTKIEVRSQPEVIEYLESHCRRDVEALETLHKRELGLIAAPDQLEESVLRYLRTDGREVRPGGRRKKR